MVLGARFHGDATALTPIQQAGPWKQEGDNEPADLNLPRIGQSKHLDGGGGNDDERQVKREYGQRMTPEQGGGRQEESRRMRIPRQQESDPAGESEQSQWRQGPFLQPKQGEWIDTGLRRQPPTPIQGRGDNDQSDDAHHHTPMRPEEWRGQRTFAESDTAHPQKLPGKEIEGAPAERQQARWIADDPGAASELGNSPNQRGKCQQQQPAVAAGPGQKPGRGAQKNDVKREDVEERRLV